MAVTSIWPYKASCGKLINYVMNPEKTDRQGWNELHRDSMNNVIFDARDEKAFYVSGINCITDSADVATENFEVVKKVWDKEGGRQCFHAYQSFEAGEINPEEAHRMGVELAQQLWGERFQVVVTTHVNTDHVHNHFAINSVSCTDGHKFVNSKSDYEAMRLLSDQMCRERGLSVIDNPGEGVKVHRKENAGQPLTRNHICRDIDACILNSENIEEVYDYLQKLGYELKVDPKLKYPALSPPDSYDVKGRRRFYRFSSLSKYDGYSLEDIIRRIDDPSYNASIINRENLFDAKRNLIVIKGKSNYNYYQRRVYLFNNKSSKRYSAFKEAGVHSYLFYKLYKYRKIQDSLKHTVKHRGFIKVSQEILDDLKKRERICDAIRYSAVHHITNKNDIVNRKLELYIAIAQCSQDRKHCWNIKDSAAASEFTQKLKKQRNELATCSFIEESWDRIESAVKENQQLKQREQEKDRRREKQ